MLTGNPYVDVLCDSGLPLRDKPDVVDPDDFLLVVPRFNSGTKSDATGAFHPHAYAFCAEHGLSRDRIFFFDNTKPRLVQADQVVSEVERELPKVVVGFHHGYTHGVQWGLRSPGHPGFSSRDRALWDRFVHAFVPIPGDEFSAPVFVWYACSTGDDPDGDPDTAPGSGDGCFADLLRDDLCGVWAIFNRVYAHTTAGHAVYNPFVKLFEGDGDKNGGVGAELVAPGGEPRKCLADRLKTPWAYCMPFMPMHQILADIDGD